MQPLHLAFLWHQHQPSYKDLLKGRYVLPWVRLHAVKDYIGMLLVLKEFPEIRCTINLVPSLLVQIQDYADGRAEDEALRLTRKPADDLDETDRRYLLEQFFAGNPERLIRVFPRYNDLFERRTGALRNGTPAERVFSEGELRDLQVWSTLAWFHPLIIKSDPTLKSLREKSRDFTESDKAAMLERQDEVIRRVLPLHRELAEAGQIEISTTPFYHPILPLLCNMESAREALPELPMPEKRSDFRPDAEVHIRRAVEYHNEVFGHPPTGMWPSEGSVSMDMLPFLDGRGFRWIATDEQILARSMEVNLSRDATAVLHAPDDLYQPYALSGGDLPAVIFRDRVLSDAIGFEYHHGDAAAGAQDFTRRVEESARRCNDKPRLVTVALDGENPWDYYGEAGLTFLRALYTQLARSDAIITTRLTDYLSDHPPERQLPRLAAGSWINADFAVWIGQAEDRAAWSLLAEARETVARREAEQPPLDPETVRRAWEHIYIAEGSDWCWWFGTDRTSDQDYLFDGLFRSHLANAYTLIGEPPPAALAHPIGKPDRRAPSTRPSGALEVTIDGRETVPSEWASAGYCAIGEPASTMQRAQSGLLVGLHYGFRADGFLLRLDAAGPFRESVPKGAEVVIRFKGPRVVSLHCGSPASDRPVVRVLDAEGRPVAAMVEVAAGDILELGCPLSLLAAGAGNEIEFFVEVVLADAETQRFPHQGTIRAPVPASD